MIDMIALQKAIETKKLKSDNKSDFLTFAKNELKILTKDAEFVPFVLKRAQQVIHDKLEKQLKDTGSVYALILKARQLGASTYIAGRFYHKAVHKKNRKIVVAAHDKDTAVSLFEKTKDFIYNQPDETRPALVGGKSAAQKVKFVDTKSSYKVATAGSPEVGRGTTSTELHLSEAAFYSNDVKTIRGLLQGAPKRGAEVIFESTPNGPQGEFFRMWNEATAGNSRYLPIFLPWFDEEEYRQTPPETWEVPPHDLKYMEKYNLDIEQMYWRHLEISDLNIEGFRQEYPATPEEAFMTSGASVFDLEILDSVITSTAISQEVFDIQKRLWVPKDDGPLQIYRAPHLHERFVIGADVAQGGMSDRSDYSTAVVFSEDNEVVATYRSQRIGPKDFATILGSIGNRYNNAMIAAERNSIGVATAEVLKHNYDNLYYDDQKTYEDPNHLPGFYTGSASRPKIVAGMQSALLHNEIKVSCIRLLQEMRMFVENNVGKAEAAPGATDDLVIAACIGWYVLQNRRHQLSANVNWQAKLQKWNISHDETNNAKWL